MVFDFRLAADGGTLLVNSTQLMKVKMSSPHRAKVWKEIASFGWIVLPAMIVSPVAMDSFKVGIALAHEPDASLHGGMGSNVPPVEGACSDCTRTRSASPKVRGFLSTVLNAACVLGVFTPILLSLGGRIYAPTAFLRLLGSWWLLGCAVAAAGLGLGMAVFAGRRLVDLEVDNQKVEAELRTTVCLLEATPEKLFSSSSSFPTATGVACSSSSPSCSSLANGKPAGHGSLDDGSTSEESWPFDAASSSSAATELGRAQPTGPCHPPPAPLFERLWRSLQENYELLFRNFFYLNLWLSCFDQVMIVAPYFLAAPLLFARDPSQRISLGTLVQISNSFGKVFDSLSIVSENCAH